MQGQHLRFYEATQLLLAQPKKCSQIHTVRARSVNTLVMYNTKSPYLWLQLYFIHKTEISN